MRILLVTQYWYPENGVPQRRWSWLAKILIDAGHEVCVVAPPPRNSRSIDDATGDSSLTRKVPYKGAEGETIFRSSAYRVGDSITSKAASQLLIALSQVRTLIKNRKQIEPDLVIGTVPALPTAGVTWLAAKIFGRPYVIDLRDAWPDLMGQATSWNAGVGDPSIREKLAKNGPLQLVTRVSTKVLNSLLRGARAILVTSSTLKASLESRRELFTRGASPEVVVIRNVFPVASQPTEDRESHRKNGHLNVLYAGTIGRAQNLQNALEAAKLAKQQGLQVHMTFVGAGAARELLQEKAQEFGVDARFIRLKPAELLNAYYDWADTALVHLAEWEPLRRTVPSKTYELLFNRIHISGVVEGEAADLISSLGGGDVVAPQDPLALANLWVSLGNNPKRLSVGSTGRDWVIREREEMTPVRLLQILQQIEASDDNASS